jgi:hypothetical protein
MEILIIQEKGRHKENSNFRECCSISRAFTKLGHKVQIWGKGWNNYSTLPNFDEFDIILNLENYGDEWLPNLSRIKKPLKILWAIDSHFRGLKPFKKIFEKSNYNLMLQATKDYVDKMPANKCIWFPNAYDDSLIAPAKWANKKFFIGFCGSELNRRYILNKLKLWYSLEYKEDIGVIGQKMVEAVHSYKIHFNLNIANDINYRSFETIGAGTVLLTNYNKQYLDLGFIDGYNCIFYPYKKFMTNRLFLSQKKLREIIQYYYENENKLPEIAQNGIILAKKHTYLERAKKNY